VRSAWSNIHNVGGEAGRAGVVVRVPRIEPGQRVVIAELDGPAVITQMWMTFEWPDRFHHDRAMQRNRMVSIEITWDDAVTPAVRVPVGDFFGHPLCYDVPFENAWFADPVARSFACAIPMPFRRRATVAIVNDFDKPVTVFHDIRFVTGVAIDEDDGYLHAHFARTIPTTPGTEHAILPGVRGRGRYLGTHLGIIADRFNPLDWHSGNVAFFLDDDSTHPSMLGPSLDDYAGSAWLYEKPFMHQDTGLILSRSLPGGGGHYGMYVYHRRDPIYFQSACKVTVTPAVHVSGSGLLATLKQFPNLADRLSIPHDLKALKQQVAAGEDAYFNCGRLDDVCSTAMYYLDSPAGQSEEAAKDVRAAAGWSWPVA
jgi:hypothetical protein